MHGETVKFEKCSKNILEKLRGNVFSRYFLTQLLACNIICNNAIWYIFTKYRSWKRM